MVTIGAALAGFIGFLGASEFMVRYRVEPNDDFWQHVAVFHSSKAANAVLGDSIPARGFHGVADFVNLALPGEFPAMTEVKASAYFRDKKPGRVIIALNPNIFRRPVAARLDTAIDVYVTQREPLLRISKLGHKERMLGYWLVWLSGRDFRSNSLFQPAGGILVRNPKDNHLYARMPTEFRRDAAVKNVLRDLPPANFETHKNLEIVGRIAAFIQAHGGTVCLVLFPYSPEYRQAARAYPRFEASRAVFKSYAERIGVRFVDFWEFHDDSRFFTDPSHLNEDGAKTFSPAAVRDCFG